MTSNTRLSIDNMSTRLQIKYNLMLTGMLKGVDFTSGRIHAMCFDTNRKSKGVAKLLKYACENNIIFVKKFNRNYAKPLVVYGLTDKGRLTAMKLINVEVRI